MAQLQQNKQALEAFRQTVLLYEQQVAIHQRMAAELETEADKNSMAQNFDSLVRSLGEVKEEEQKLGLKNEEDLQRVQRLANDINQLKPEIGRLMSRKQELIRQLTQDPSYDSEVIEDIFREAFRRLWFFEDFKREDANSALCGKRDGTFLIRKANKPGKFALSIVHAGKVVHAQIDCFERRFEFGGGVEGRVFCFDNHLMFPSLDLLVQHYHRKSLKDHNPQLDAFLKYPVGYYSATDLTYDDDDEDEDDLEDAASNSGFPKSFVDE